MSAKKASNSAKKAEVEAFDTGEIVLGKLRGFPPWPGMVVDPNTVPKAVSKERPTNKKSIAYAVRFFPTGDYAWLGPKELKRLTTADINAFVRDAGAGRKSGDLLAGYRSALDPTAWEKEQAATPPPKKRKSKTKAKEEQEEEEEEDEIVTEDAPADDDGEEAEPEEDEKPGKKRKRASSPAPSKAKAKPKSGKAAAKGGKKGGKGKSKAAVESEDDAGEDAEAEAEGDDEEAKERPSKKAKAVDGTAKLESDPEALKVREWRHKLQKMFLSSNKSLPKEDEMPAVNTLFTTVEGYQNMTIDYLTFSKIGKVMRHIHLLEPGKVPRDDEYNFRDRAKALVDNWHDILNANKTSAAAADVAQGTASGGGEGDLTVLDVTIDEA
ncbi:hypothetical protein B0H17DRAFT_458673 [Mycena rosella]|uniref:PWWP domain-containing protein n=1 Tax=Mycena rosella TaxID=1033263 RepID=A0AAD7CCK9_MYCRO|nr:hypothetical protein B0H17DRAFT_458673 [Mycena rosella]